MSNRGHGGGTRETPNKRLRRGVVVLMLLASLLPLLPGCGRDGGTVVVGSKLFPESEILGAALAALAREAGAEAQWRDGLGDSGVLFPALQAGEIDAYVEYTGTLRQELLAGEDAATPEALRARLAERGLGVAARLGFENNFAIGVPRPLAERLDLAKISDLADHPELRFVFGAAFLDRPDGWPGLKAAYNLPQTDVIGVEQGLRYVAVEEGRSDGIDLYTTDSKISPLGLVALEDDRGFFTRYEAVVLYRLALDETRPEVVAAWRELEGAIDADTMIAANAAVELENRPPKAAAAGLLEQVAGGAAGLDAAARTTAGVRVRRIWDATLEHLLLVGVSMALAVLIAVPLGVWAGRDMPGGWAVLTGAGLVQTIPSLALLVVLIGPLGLGFWPAIVALTLYALLPIVRNTHAALVAIDPAVRESAAALGLTPADRLLRVELPLALPGILAGIKIAAVITVGFATLGAFVGAGGYGEPIFRGLRLGPTNGYPLILEGALPAAVMALATQAMLGLAERLLVSPGLRR